MHKHHHPGLLVVDIQGKLARLVEESDAPDCQYRQAGARARVLGLPAVWLEQNPDKLGATVPESVIAAGRRSCAAQIQLRRPGGAHCGDRAGRKRGRALAGMWHRDPYPRLPRAWGLLASGTAVSLVVDVVSSRCAANRDPPSASLRQGAALTSVEMCLYELMGTAAIRHFARSSPGEMTAMMDNMAPFLFALIAFGAALMVTVTGMAATRHHLAWLWLGIMLFFRLWWTLPCRRPRRTGPL